MTIPMIFASLLALTGVTTPGATAAEQDPPKAPAHQVVAIYFHRTERCPTCKRIGALAEKGVVHGFEKETKSRVVEFHFVDYQNEKNAKLAAAYGIESPTLVLLSVFEGETVCWTSLPKVWQLVGKPDDFRAYVQQGVMRYLKQTRQDAERERDQAKEDQR